LVVSGESTVPQASFRGIRDGDEDKVMELIRAAFGESWPDLPIGGAPIDYLRWKIRSPQGEASYTTVGEIDGRFVALSVEVTREATVHGRKYLVGAGGGDVCVHPEYQGRGIYRQLSKADDDRSRERFSFGIGNSTNVSVVRMKSSRGLRPIVHPFDHMLRPLSNWSMEGSALSPRRLARSSRFRARQALSRVRWRPYSDPLSIELTPVDSFDSRMDRFSESAGSQFDLMLSRDMSFLNWRYCDRRAGAFRTVVAEHDGEVLGLSALRLRGDTCHIADLLALPGRLDVARALVEDAIEYGEQLGVSGVECGLPRHHSYMPVLRRLGFIRRDSDLSRAYSPWEMTEELDFLESDDRSRIHLTAGDGDTI